jgi:hypothetical protein
MIFEERPSLSSYITRLLSSGEAVFCREQALRALGVTPGAFLDAAERLHLVAWSNVVPWADMRQDPERPTCGRVCLELYLRNSDMNISRAHAEARMFAKLRNQGLLTDLSPLLSVLEAQSLTKEKAMKAFVRVFSELVVLLPGEPWAKTDEMKKSFRMS